LQALPTAFCQEHLPERDERITLEDEEGHEYSTTYLTGSLCLSAGWRRFANQHKLVDGDCLVFQLIKTTKFKVRVMWKLLQWLELCYIHSFCSLLISEFLDRTT